jgi:hypothetical protein
MKHFPTTRALSPQHHAPRTAIKELHYFCLKIKKIVQIPQVTPKTELFLNHFLSVSIGGYQRFQNPKPEPETLELRSSTISAPVSQLTARLAGRSEASAHQNYTDFQNGRQANLTHFNRKEKTEPKLNHSFE